MNESTDTSYVLPVPSGHRTDWGESFAETLDSRLRDLQPQNVDRELTGTFSGRGGSLIVRVVNAISGEVIEACVWEDEADVRWRDAVKEFRLARQPDPPSWIPEAVAFVETLISENGFV